MGSHIKMIYMYTRHDDHGATYYRSVTRGTPHEPPYRERVGMALYMAGLSPKLQFLAAYVSYICYELIVFLY